MNNGKATSPNRQKRSLSSSRFEKSFGESALETLPSEPGVYFVYDSSGAIAYIGKARNLRRRLFQYRNAKRIKKHQKMRKIVAEGRRLEWTVCASSLEAELREVELIQAHRPRLNLAQAFSHRYYFIGISIQGDNLEWIITENEQALKTLTQMRWFGAFRSKSAFQEFWRCCLSLFSAAYHLIPSAPHPTLKDMKIGHRRLRCSRISKDRILEWEAFFSGRNWDALQSLSLDLLEASSDGGRRSLRSNRSDIGKKLRMLRWFFNAEPRRLARLTRNTPHEGLCVPQKLRDLLPIVKRHERREGATKQSVSALSSFLLDQALASQGP